MQTMFFEQCLGADMSRSLSMGEGARDEDMFMEVALGRLDGDLQPVPVGEQHHVDVVVVNQYIRTPGPQLEGWVHGRLGSDLAEQLDARGFRGAFCVITALNPEALAEVRTLPGVDIALPKSTPHADMAARVLEAVEAKHLRVQTVLSGFLRGALEATTAIADLQQSGGTDASEALRELAGLHRAVRRDVRLDGVPEQFEGLVRWHLKKYGSIGSLRLRRLHLIGIARVQALLDLVDVAEVDLHCPRPRQDLDGVCDTEINHGDAWIHLVLALIAVQAIVAQSDPAIGSDGHPRVDAPVLEIRIEEDHVGCALSERDRL